MADFSETPALVPCCMCGILIEPNPSSMCLSCLRQQADFAREIPNSSSVIYCKSCGRYQTSPTTWAFAELESPELLKICMNRITGLKEMKVIDARFLYTEPHSRRIRISLTVQKPYNSAMLRQTLIITFVVQLQQCPECCEAATPREHWIANVQVREAGEHKRTLFWLEQQILNCRAHSTATSVERKHDGIDFHFATRALANNFVNFLKSKLPVKVEESNKLMGEDIQSSIQDRRYSISVRVPPINRQELVLLPSFLVQKTGNQSFIAVCFKISKNIKMIDPVTCKIISVDGPTYWKNPFETLLTLSSLKKFVVVSIDVSGPKVGRFQPADIELTDEDTYQDRIIVKSHLGCDLKVVLPMIFVLQLFLTMLWMFLRNMIYQKLSLSEEFPNHMQTKRRSKGHGLLSVLHHNSLLNKKISKNSLMILKKIQNSETVSQFTRIQILQKMIQTFKNHLLHLARCRSSD